MKNIILDFKDEKPEKTVMKIKNILHELNCVTREEWLCSVQGIYSVHIVIEGTSICANGKGTTKALTLASGYGELIERLQSLINFRMSSVFNYYISEKKICVCPDQIVRKSHILCEEEMKWLSSVANKKEILDLDHKLMNFTGGQIIELVYNAYDSSDFIAIPYVLADLYYGSNGMAAGNSKEEAMVQGISEIFERFVVKEIVGKRLKNDISFADITGFLCKRYESISDIITECEKSGYKIHVIDLSYEYGLPVIATAFVNKIDMQYFINFGCHPVLEIAVTRSITELLQGRDIGSIVGMSKLESNINDISIRKNRNSIFVNGVGVYPYIIFNLKQKDANVIWTNKYDNNKEILSTYVQLIKNMGKEIYYRDMSFLGFPAYHIIIPGFSEIAEDIVEVNRFFDLSETAKIIMDIHNINDDAARKVIDLLNIANPDSTTTVADIIHLPIYEQNQNPLSDITIDLLGMMLCAYVEDFANGIKYSRRYIKFLEENGASKEIVKYYRTILAIFSMKQEGLSLDIIKAILKVFLDQDYIDEVLNDIQPEKIFTYFVKLKCTSLKCEKCELQEVCCHLAEMRLYHELIQKSEKYYIETRKRRDS